jgi:uncharacterized protein DUF6194
VDQAGIIDYIARAFPGMQIARPSDGPGAGDTFFMCDLIDQVPFATLVTKDYGEFDNSSRLDRPDLFRLNVGVSSGTFRRLFGEPGDGVYDFAALDRLMPHPVYAAQFWVCVLNPSDATFEGLTPLLDEANARAARRMASRQP